MFFRASGGVLYHWRALRSARRWAPFRDAVATWLNAWAPVQTELVLIGPSAGHTLPTAWLKRFEHIHAYDLDPLAPPLFRLRHRGARVCFHRRDVFWRDGVLCSEVIDDVLGRAPHGRDSIL